MDALEYLKVKARMTNNCDTCRNCPLDNVENMMSCVVLESDCPEQAVEIVEKWVKENPVKTYLSVLLEKFPNACTNSNGTPMSCPHKLFDVDGRRCPNISCDKCWNREYREG